MKRLLGRYSNQSLLVRLFAAALHIPITWQVSPRPFRFFYMADDINRELT